jgi:GH25 family lysozyme M1 (1,4-beta-N-acetylmuramidase)
MSASRWNARLVGASLALASLTLIADAAAASGSDGGNQPTAAARAHGIDHPGQAYMGWRTKDEPGPDGPGASPAYTGGVYGLDVSSYQGNVDWSSWYADGSRFAYVKATEGTGYQNPYFSQQYGGSYDVGMIRGAYHFATPDTSTGAAQADYFAAHGGGWSADGKTLPGVLDIEFNPYGAECYGLSQSQMVSWIGSFATEYRAQTGRDAVIYTNFYWWVDCTGNTTAFNATNPLWIAHYGSDAGSIPGAWGFFTFWQYTSTPLDEDWFNGTYDRLQALALG